MKKILIISAILSVLALTGCKDFLVQEPVTSQSSEQLLSDYTGLNNAVAGAYSPLASASWYGATYFTLDADTRAGIAAWPKLSDFQSGRMATGFTLNYNDNSTSGLWSFGYYIISAANNVIDQLDAIGETLINSNVSQQDLDNLRAECLFLRALSHFDLLRIYSRNDQPELGVPVILHTDHTSTEQPARNTIREVYDQIEKDLFQADSLMAEGYSRSGVADANAVANKYVIKALAARVYLYDATFTEGLGENAAAKYQAAADYATEVIESGKYKMWTAEEYPSVWHNDVGSGEIIFEVYGKASNGYDAYWEAACHMTNPNGYADICASPFIYDSYEEGDVRGTKGVRQGVGPNDDGSMFVTDPDEASGDYWTMKYPGKGDGNVTGTPDVNNCPIIRLSEMYLIRAEAIVNGATSTSTADADLNTIRSNRGASSEEASEQAIWNEYKLEFCFEGQFWFTTARLATTNHSWAVIEYDADEVVRRNNHSILDASSIYWALPLSRSEMDVNKNLVQMPGYER